MRDSFSVIMLLQRNCAHRAKPHALAAFDAGLVVDFRCAETLLSQCADGAYTHRRAGMVLWAARFLDHQRHFTGWIFLRIHLNITPPYRFRRERFGGFYGFIIAHSKHFICDCVTTVTAY